VSGAQAPAPRFRRLISPGAEGESVSAEEALDDWRASVTTGRRLAVNMISSVDGRIAVAGRSGPLGSPADRSLFHALRARADAVLVAAGTVRAERYGPLIRDAGVRARRELEGLAPQPLAVIVTRSLGLEATLPLLDDPASRVVILTPAAGELPACRAQVEYVRTDTLRAGLDELGASHGAHLILCEGGPGLNASLAAEALIDELFLSISPTVVGDLPGAGMLLSGGGPQEPLALELHTLLEHDSHLFTRYVSRA
jgi:riboflavin biosynthesis pyrimidine reductase